MFKRLVVMVIGAGLVLTSCGSRKLKPNLTASERLAVAKEIFDDGDYLDAKTQFKIVTLNFPGSSVADTAQYYLAECHFQLKEYILAHAEYERLIRTFPNSPLVDDARYKLGLCHFKLSPKYALDQEYTNKAIQEFQQFLEDYPQSDLVPEVEKKLKECRNKLARKEYQSGELYRKMGDFKAALIYYRSVLDIYYDTKYAPNAQYWKAECLRKSGQTQEAEEQFKVFIEKYPQHRLVAKAQGKMQELQKKLLDVPKPKKEEMLSNPSPD